MKDSDLTEATLFPAGARVSLDELEILKRKLFKDRGFDLSQYTPAYVQRRVNACLMRRSCTFRQYLRLLESDPVEYQMFFDNFTVNVTEFFRDKSVWKVLEESALPQILSEKISDLSEVRGPKSEAVGHRTLDIGHRTISLRIWSAGCSSGEEPYSIAIMAKEAIERLEVRSPRSEVQSHRTSDLGHRTLDIGRFLVTIFATDIDDASLAKAQKGIYTKEQLKNVPPQILQKYFTPCPKSEVRGPKSDIGHRTQDIGPCLYQIPDEIKRMVTFKKHHFFKDKPFTQLDMIFCRNVTIYLTTEMKDKLLEIFCDSMNHHGLLVTGKAETIFSKTKYHFYPVNAKEHIFRKERRDPELKTSGGGEGEERRRNFWWGKRG